MAANEDLYLVAFEIALELNGVDAYSFAPNWEAARVAGKWFMITTIRDGERILVLKAPPEDVQALQQAFDEITPGYHMNKKHWYTVHAGPAIDAAILRELVTDAYLTVVENLPKAQRPFGWQTYYPN